MKKWRVASNGPDWRDVRAYMMEVEKTHACTIYVGMQPGGGKGGSDWFVNVVAVLPILDEQLQQVVVGAGGTFPHRDFATVEGLAHALVAKVDWLIGSECYVQVELFN